MPEPRQQPSPHPRTSRRHFLRSSTVAAASAWLAGPYFVRGQNLNSRLNIAAIGVGGKGGDDMDAVAPGNNLVALCDVEEAVLNKRKKAYPQAATFRDYRKMLDEMKEIDAVTVSAPDHHHAFASIMAMKLGKHVYCQTPLAHSVSEARLMREVAASRKVATQMGNQGSAHDGLRRALEVIRAGTIGAVHQVHIWTSRPIWPQGLERPKDTPSTPSGLDWDLFVGPAPGCPYHPAYHPFKWRGWRDFGTGALGDMGCHLANMPFRALDLGHPISVETTSQELTGETYPVMSEIRFDFPARGDMPKLSLFWYDGGRRPPEEITADVAAMVTRKDPKKKFPASGCLLVGAKGQFFSTDDYGTQFRLLPEDRFRDFVMPASALPRSPGHYREWIEACKGGPPAFSNFAVAGLFSEAILAGNVALQVGGKIEWDGPGMRVTNNDKAAPFVRRVYREGWQLGSA